MRLNFVATQWVYLVCVFQFQKFNIHFDCKWKSITKKLCAFDCTPNFEWNNDFDILLSSQRKQISLRPFFVRGYQIRHADGRFSVVDLDVDIFSFEWIHSFSISNHNRMHFSVNNNNNNKRKRTYIYLCVDFNFGWQVISSNNFRRNLIEAHTNAHYTPIHCCSNI